MLRSGILTIGLGAVVALPSARASAQPPGSPRRESTDSSLKAYCTEHRGTVERGRSHPEYRRSLERLVFCPELGPEVMAALWRRGDVEGEELAALLTVSRYVRDQRILRAVIAAAEDPSRSVATRLGALRLLAAYADPSVRVSEGDLRNPPTRGERNLPRTEDAPTGEGAERLPPGAERSIMATFSRLAASDPDPVVRRAAEYLARGFGTEK